MQSSVLVIAAHPDDEVLGCGGTVAKFSDQGARIHVAFLANGVSSRKRGQARGNKEIDQRRNAAAKAAEILGIESISFADLSDNCMDTHALLEVTQIVEELVARYQPDTVFTHHAGDLNIDHRIAHQAVATACRPQLGHPVKKLVCFEVPSSTEWQLAGSSPVFEPNYFVDISLTLDRKLAALDAYAAELRDWPHPRSRRGVEHLLHWRGATVGFEAAEAFVLGRLLE